MLFARLKQDTQSHHTALENTIDIFGRIKTTYMYQATLQIFYGFYKPLETALSAVPGIEVFDFHVRRKTPLLHGDLLELGLNAQTILQLPQCANLPPLNTLPQAFGCLYVLEGATLGGQIIRRHLQHESPSLPCHFFQAYGANVGQQWKTFQSIGERSMTDITDQNNAVESAQATFNHLQTWFQQQSSEVSR